MRVNASATPGSNAPPTRSRHASPTSSTSASRKPASSSRRCTTRSPTSGGSGASPSSATLWTRPASGPARSTPKRRRDRRRGQRLRPVHRGRRRRTRRLIHRAHRGANVNQHAPGYYPPDMRPGDRAGFPSISATPAPGAATTSGRCPMTHPSPRVRHPDRDGLGRGPGEPALDRRGRHRGIEPDGHRVHRGLQRRPRRAGLALGLWARSRAIKGIDTPISAPMAMGAIIMSGVILGIAGFILLSFLIISLI